MQTLQNGILKMNHLLFDLLFKKKETCSCYERQKIACCFEVLLENEGIVVDSC